MVAITVRFDDLRELVSKRLPRDREELNQLLFAIKCELSGEHSHAKPEPILDDTELQIENVDTNRPDTWSPEGIARALRGTMGLETGLRKYKVSKKKAIDIDVHKGLRNVRPFIACVVARRPKINDTVIRGLIHLQDKLDQSYGRRRRRSSIGFYDFDLISPPLEYRLAALDEVSFIPLDTEEPMTLRQILEKHPKGLEYGHIVREFDEMPILLDSKDKVLSFPPIINSNDLGRVTPDTKNILVEVTGTSEETVNNVLTILATALADRGAEIQPASVHYSYGEPRTAVTPNLRERRLKLSLEEVSRLVGLSFTKSQTISLLRRARFNAVESDTGQLTVLVPCYRLDILHPVDVIEDIAITHGLNKIEPRWPAAPTVGGLSPMEEFSDLIREIMVGLGFQEILTFTMTNPEKLFTKMNQLPSRLVEVSNPKIMTMTCLRSWLLPSLLEFLSNNIHVEYPQRIYEVGDCTRPDASLPNRAGDTRKLACASSHSRVNFTEIKSYLEPLMLNLGLDFSLKRTSHPSFLGGRAGSILIGDREVGVVGEVHPQVLENWKLEEPVAAMELDLTGLFQMRR
mgnify:CR=1 FL=1